MFVREHHIASGLCTTSKSAEPGRPRLPAALVFVAIPDTRTDDCLNLTEKKKLCHHFERELLIKLFLDYGVLSQKAQRPFFPLSGIYLHLSGEWNTVGHIIAKSNQNGESHTLCNSGVTWYGRT